MDSSTSHPVIYSKMPQKLPAEGISMPTVQRSNLPRQDSPTFFNKLSRQLPVYDTPPSSIRYRRKVPGYGIQPSPASYPELCSQTTQSSSTRHHTCRGIVKTLVMPKTVKTSALSGPAYDYGYPYQA